MRACAVEARSVAAAVRRVVVERIFFFSFIRVVGLLGWFGWLSLSDQSCLMFDEIEVSIDVLVRGKKRFHAEGRAGQFSCRITRSSR